MRIWILYGYIAFLFLATCTENVSVLLSQQVIRFRFNGSPSVKEFFYNDFDLQDSTYVNQKLGHILSFFILSLIVYWIWRSVLVNLLVSLAVALSTEVSQLFFSRSGRLLDVGYDMSGALLFLLFLGSYRGIDYGIKKKHLFTLNRR